MDSSKEITNVGDENEKKFTKFEATLDSNDHPLFVENESESDLKKEGINTMMHMDFWNGQMISMRSLNSNEKDVYSASKKTIYSQDKLNKENSDEKNKDIEVKMVDQRN